MTDRAAVPYITGSAVHCRQCRTYQARKVQGPQPPDGGAGPRPCRAGDRRGGDSAAARGGTRDVPVPHTASSPLSLSLSLSARAASAQWGATRDVPVPHTARGNRRGTSPAPRAGDTHPMHRGTSRGRSGEAPEAALRRVQDARSRRSATIIIINNNNS